jgi:hypothetical protein
MNSPCTIVIVLSLGLFDTFQLQRKPMLMLIARDVFHPHPITRHQGKGNDDECILH